MTVYLKVFLRHRILVIGRIKLISSYLLISQFAVNGCYSSRFLGGNRP